MVEVGALTYDITIEDGKITGQLKEVDKKVQQVGKNTQKNADQIRRGFNVAAAAIGVAGAGLTVFAKSATDFTVEYVKESKQLSRELGIGIRDASQLRFVTNRLGVTTEQASAMFGIFAKNIQASTKQGAKAVQEQAELKNRIAKTKFEIKETATEIKKNGDKSGELNIKLQGLNITLRGLNQQLKSTEDPFKRLGINVRLANGQTKDFNQLLLEVADKFKGMPDGLEKTALSMELFGRSGKDMIKVLNLGSQGISELQRESDRLGLTLTTETVANVAKFIESQKSLKATTDATKIAVGTLTTPILTEFNNRVNSVIQALIGQESSMRGATAAFLAFGGPVLSATAGLIAFIANLQNALPLLAKLRFALIALPWMAVAAAAAAASIIIVNKWLDTKRVIDNTKTALQNSARAAEDAMARMDKAVKKGKATQEQAERLRKSIEAGRESAERTSRSWQYLLGPTLNKQIESLKRPPDPFRRRQHGGSVMAGRPYIVGEKRPELFVPKHSGNILPRVPGQGTNVYIGTINDKSDADYLIKLINSNQHLENRGMSPAIP